MATIDHVPEVCLQVSILQLSAATLYFFSPWTYFVRFLRKWGTKFWFHQLFPPTSIFLGLWVTPIHPILFTKKPTKFPSNNLQWICPLGIPKLSSEIGQRCLRDGEIGSIGCLRKRVEIGSFMIWINDWPSHCPGWRGMIHSWFLHLISSPMP